MALRDFIVSNARRFYSSMGNPLGWKGLQDNAFDINESQVNLVSFVCR